MAAFTTRRLTADDLAVFRAVRSEGLSNDPGAFRVSVADDDLLSPEAWKQRLTNGFVVSVEAEGRVLGIGGFAQMPGTKADHKGLIWGMYVRPEGRGKGVADAVMTALLDHARTVVRQVQLTVVADNARAVAFYERHGFTRYGVEPDAIAMEGRFADEALMWRKL